MADEMKALSASLEFAKERIQDLEREVRRMQEQVNGYQSAWKDEIDAKRGAVRMLEGMQDKLHKVLNGGHITKDMIRDILGIAPAEQQ